MLSFNDITKAVKSSKKKVNINIDTIEAFEQKHTIPERVIRNVDLQSNNELQKNENVEIIEQQDKEQDNPIIEDRIIYKFNEIINLPSKIDTLLDLNNYYTYGVNKENSILYSLLYLLDKDFKLSDTQEQSRIIDGLINLLSENVEQYFKKNNYSIYGLKKLSLVEQFNKRVLSEDMVLYMSDYFKVNIILIDIENEVYVMKKKFVEDYNSIIIIKNRVTNNLVYLPLLHMFGELPDKELCKNIFSKYINKGYVDEELTELKHMRHYTVTDLQRLSKQFNLPLYNVIDEKNKKKTKQELYDQLKIIIHDK